jgi:hypothetical protein
MRSDEEIEHILEDWLADEAQPMPHDVLENALETVARTNQQNRRRLGPDWLRSRPMGLLATAAVVILVVLASGLTVDLIGSFGPTESASAGIPQTWDPAVDFDVAFPHRNPAADGYGNAGVWSFLRSPEAEHNPASYFLLPDFADPLTTFGGRAWYDSDYLNLLIGKRTADDTIYLHPWSDGAIRKDAIVGWTSPISGQITIEGTVARTQHSCPVDAGNMVFSVDRAAVSLKEILVGFAQNARFSLTTSVVVGESVYFIVDADMDASCDLTELRVTIRHG